MCHIGAHGGLPVSLRGCGFRRPAQIKGADQSFRYEDMEATNTEKYLVVNGNKYPVKEWVTKSKSTDTDYATTIYRRYTTQEAAK